MSIHFQFVLGCVISALIIAVVYRKASCARQFFCFLSDISLLYCFAYRTGLLVSFEDFRVIAISVVVLFLVLFFGSVRLESKVEPSKISGPRKTFAFTLLIFITLFFIVGNPWTVRTFPLDNVDAVLFTLNQNKTGSGNLAVELICSNILKPVLLMMTSIFCIEWFVAFVITKTGKTVVFSLVKKKVWLYSWKKIYTPLNQLLCLTFFLCVMVLFGSSASLVKPVTDIISVYCSHESFVNSDLYLNDYIFPDSVTISFPEKKKNLIVVMMESMETNFQKYTPELNNLNRSNLSFFPGGQDVALTGWTIAAQVSKFCGIPLNLPNGFDNSDKISKFLPQATCLMNILNSNDYQQVYMQGSNGNFASTQTFWQQHRVNEFLDLAYYRQSGIGVKSENLWGLSDFTIYDLAKKKLQYLSSQTEFFALYLSTIDTHFPEGEKSEACRSEIEKSDNGQYPAVLRCASRQIYEFVDWIKRQSWYKNTTIVIIGDHTWSTFTDLLKLPEDSTLYWVNVFINSSKIPIRNSRQFSSLDMFPTIIESLGADIEGRRLGLGTSLFSEEPTLLEKYGKKTLDSMLRVKSYQYDYFFNGGSFVREN